MIYKPTMYVSLSHGMAFLATYGVVFHAKEIQLNTPPIRHSVVKAVEIRSPRDEEVLLARPRPDRHEEPRQDDHGVGQDEDRQQDAQTHLVVLRVSMRIMCWPLYRDCTIHSANNLPYKPRILHRGAATWGQRFRFQVSASFHLLCSCTP